MESTEALARRVQAAVAGLESVLDACGERGAGVRCGPDSRTVGSLTNHVADWLQLVRETVVHLGTGRGRVLRSEVIAEVDAGMAKASAGRSWTETRDRLAKSAAALQEAIAALSNSDLDGSLGSDGGVMVSVASYVQKLAVTHVREHTAAIHAGLLAAATVGSRDHLRSRARQEKEESGLRTGGTKCAD